MNLQNFYSIINTLIITSILNLKGIIAEDIGFSSIVHFCAGDICFSPIVIYGAIIVGCFAQISICGLCFWVLFHGRKVRRSARNYIDSSSASISSKTGLYDH